MSTPSRIHWNESGDAPVADTVKVAGCPAVTVVLAGDVVMMGVLPPPVVLLVLSGSPLQAASRSRAGMVAAIRSVTRRRLVDSRFVAIAASCWSLTTKLRGSTYAALFPTVPHERGSGISMRIDACVISSAR